MEFKKLTTYEDFETTTSNNTTPNDMSDKLFEFIKKMDKEESNWFLSDELLAKAMQSYADQELKDVLDGIHESHIEEGGFQKHKKDDNSLDKRYGFQCGAKWILNHIKQRKG